MTDHKTEFNFEFDNRPYEFTDSETKEKVRLNPAAIKKDFTSQMANYHHDLYLKCAKLKVDLIEADVNADFDEILKAYAEGRVK